MGSPWAYKIDYAKEIANDEREIAYLSGEVCKSFSKVVQAQVEAGNPYARQLQTTGVLALAPELYEVLGLSKDEARALFVAEEIEAEHIPTLYGPVQRGDWSAGIKIFDRIGPNGYDTLGRWYVPTENSRLEGLRKAKASLTRHKRNQEKYGK